MRERAHISDPAVATKPRVEANHYFVAGSLKIIRAKGEPRSLIKRRRFDHRERAQDKLAQDRRVNFTFPVIRASPDHLDLSI
ncbi:MAG: hypothetical protein ACREPW_02850 [Candidatus Binataceae bacterium]